MNGSPFNKRETMPGNGNLAKYPALMKSWVLEGNLQLPLYQTRKRPNYILNISPDTRRYLQSSHHIKEASLGNKRTVIEKPQLIKKRRAAVLNPNRYIDSTAPAPTAQGSYQERGWKESVSQSNRKFVVRLSPRNVREATP